MWNTRLEGESTEPQIAATSMDTADQLWTEKKRQLHRAKPLYTEPPFHEVASETAPCLFKMDIVSVPRSALPLFTPFDLMIGRWTDAVRAR